MADQSHLDILQQGVEAWNSWRKRNPSMDPDLSGVNLWGANLSGADLSGADLSGVDFSRVDLSGTNLSRANLWGVDLSGVDLSEVDLSEAILSGVDLSEAILSEANLSGVDLSGVDLSGANLSSLPFAIIGADLTGANLSGADLSGADLTEADLTGANLSEASLIGAKLSRANLSEAILSEANLSDANLTNSVLVKTDLQRATLVGCRIYGISAWNLKLEGAKQQNLNVTDYEEPAIMVDNLEVAQFIYLLLNNERIRQVIDTITSKVVLILGRFTPERKAVLEAIRDSLRQHDYLPVLFDFDKPTSRDLTETISTLAHMARFIIADLSDARSLPQELQAIVPDLPSVPVQPLVLASDEEYGMFEHFKRYHWVLEVYRYDDPDEVLTSLETKIISPAEAKARELSR
jgi:uncharacterized protein YjbI with pentapeptide repeats